MAKPSEGYGSRSSYLIKKLDDFMRERPRLITIKSARKLFSIPKKQKLNLTNRTRKRK